MIALFMVIFISGNKLTVSSNDCTFSEISIASNVTVIEIINYKETFIEFEIQGSEELIMKDQKHTIIEGRPGIRSNLLRAGRTHQQKLMVMSGISGVGKSFVSLYTAHALANFKIKVLLVDLDFQNPTLHLSINQTPDYPIDYWLKKNKCIENYAILSICENLDLLANVTTEFGTQKHRIEGIKELPGLITPLLENYQFIVFDTRTGLGDLNLVLMENVDRILLVSSVDPAAIIDTYTFIKTSQPFLSKADIQLVINQIVDESLGYKTYQNLNFALKQFLNYEINLLGVIPADDLVRFSLKERKPLWSLSMISPAFNAIQEFAGLLYTSNLDKLEARLL
jgi:flagellar biosynthesis protein FlhG